MSTSVRSFAQKNAYDFSPIVLTLNFRY
jgi:hypothetical protein